ncbi:TonB-dependent receptor plug domain-containing protein [Hyphomicrobium sp. 2TAF46]|uniref:TonB-dependent receptor plug domain-containing protein n=1 Tax=Hyphomicrobium sp. 2TAF46 TaxID=3233019 RepID=UPI003F913758
MSRITLAAIAAVCVVAVEPYQAEAQQALTPGGDVTADEASVLPPVVVQSPTEPLGRRAQPKSAPQVVKASTSGNAKANTAEAGEGSAEGTGPNGAASGGPAIGTGIFTLGQIDMIGGSTVTNEAMWTFNKNSLDQAVNLLPGVSSTNSGGSRNEKDIFVRGFNRYQVPLSIDGVRVYLPADNRLDFSRFLTPDLAEVQVAKGYVSVLNGPGGEGGAINLVSRKPTKEIELEGRTGLVTDGDLSSLNSWNAYAYAGTRQKGYYAQVSGNIVDQDHFNLSHDFTPANSSTLGYNQGVAAGFPYQQKGERDNSDFRDWRINAKVGLTPNATDEYSINYTNQQGEKGAPLSVERQIVQGYFNGNTVRYWDWPQWDTSSLSWLSKTKLGDVSYIKTNAFYNTFQNSISFYPNATYTNQFTDSPYDDYSYGGFVEMGTDLIPMNTLKGAIHFRRDFHNEQSINYKYVPTYTVSLDPAKRQSEETWSFALENTFHATRWLDIVTGASYDTNQVLDANGSTDKPDIDAWNWQAAAIYSYSNTGKVHADVSSRTRFPTLFERYSTRFGSKTANPDIAPERATNYEIGISDTVFRNVHVSSAIFYANIDDSIQNAFSGGANSKNSIIGFNADGYNYGFELSADWDVMPGLRLGGNYTYLERHLDFDSATLAPGSTTTEYNSVAATQLEGTPRHKALIYLAWKATDRLTLTPSVELATDRTALVTSCASTLVNTTGQTNATGNCGKTSGYTGKPNYIELGAYALVNFQAEYAFTEGTTIAIGAMNLLDENYSLADGFPEPGRQLFANVRARF